MTEVEEQHPITDSKKEIELPSDAPESYFAVTAYNYSFDKRLSELSETSDLNSPTRYWYENPDEGEVMCATSYQDKKVNIAGKDLSSSETYISVLTFKDMDDIHLMEEYFDIVAKILPSEHKFKAIEALKVIDMNSNLELQLTNSIRNISGIDANSLRDIKLEVYRGNIHPKSWNRKEIEPLTFDLKPHIKNPLDTQNSETTFQEVQRRLSLVPAQATPDKDFIQHRTRSTSTEAEFVNIEDISGGVGTSENWGDLLGSRRPATKITGLAESLQEKGLIGERNNEIRLYRFKTSEDDPGQLFVDEGNHRVAVLTALEVSKFPALVETVVIS